MCSDMGDYYGGCAAEVADGSDVMMEDDGLGLGDAGLMMRERRNAEAEVERLTTQFERELWKQWRPFLLGTDRPRKSRRQRRPSPKCNGSSPLKKVTAQDDIPTEDVPTFEDDDEGFLRRTSTDSTDSTDSTSDFSSDAGSGASSPTWLTSLGPVFPEDSLENDWPKFKSSSTNGDGMLPNWGFS